MPHGDEGVAVNTFKDDIDDRHELETLVADDHRSHGAG